MTEEYLDVTGMKEPGGNCIVRMVINIILAKYEYF
jgi:hypothetical protein